MMGRTQKLIWLLVGLVMLTGICVSADPVTVTLWDDSVVQADWLKAEIKNFQAQNPGITIKRSLMVSIKYKELLNVAARSKSLPDIVTIVDQSWFPEMAKSGFFQPITKYADVKFQKRFPKGSFMESCNVYKGEVYSYPMMGSLYWAPFYINGDLFKQAGLVDKNGKTLIPKNWAEVRKYAKIITEKGNGRYFGFGLSSRPLTYTASFYYEWARAAGSRAAQQDQLLDVDFKLGRYNFNDPAIIKMFNFLLQLEKDNSIYPGYLSQEDEMLRVLFAEGKFAMMTCGNWVIKDIDGRFPDFKNYECVMIPPYDASGYKAYCDTKKAKPYFLITRDSKNPDTAWKFLDYMATMAPHIRMVEQNVNVSIFPEANAKAKIDIRQWREYIQWSQNVLKQHPMPYLRNPELGFVEYTTPMPDQYNVFWGILSHQIAEKDIPKTLQDLENRYNKALQDAFDKAQKKGYHVSLKDLYFPDWNEKVDYMMN